jgi:putative ABC transport system permease protein
VGTTPRDLGLVAEALAAHIPVRIHSWAVRFLPDVRFALRGFRRSAGLTAVTVIVLALGIGANTAIFSVVDAVVLRPLPFAAPDRLVAIPDGIMYLDYLDLRDQARSFQGLAVHRLEQAMLTAPGEPELVNVVSASAELFSVLGVAPVLGRGFAAGEDQVGRPRLAVLSDGLWRRRLGGDRGAVGRTLVLDGLTLTVIGVMPPAFRFPLDEDPGDLWITQGREWRDQRQWRGYRAFRSIGRLAPGVAVGQARAEVAGIAARLAHLHPRENAGRTITLAAYDRTVKTGRTAFLILLAAVGVVLLVACANVANLQLVRAHARRRDTAIRAALGAGRGRLVRQLLTESLVLALFAGALGVAAAASGLRVLVAWLPADVPRLHPIGLDGRVLLYTLGAALGTALLVGVAPALQGSRADLAAVLRGGDRGTTGGRGTVRAVLLVAEIALAVVLLAGAGLLLRSFARVAAIDPGFEARSLALARIKLSIDTDADRLFTELLPRVEALPGAASATFVRELPYGRVFNSWNFTLEDRPAPPPERPWWTNARGVGPGYFATLGIPIRQGRAFERADFVAPARVVVVNEAFVRRNWPQGSALGHRVRAYERDVEIVGVAGDTRGSCDQAGCAGAGAGRLDRAPVPEVYVPNTGFGQCYLAVRAAAGTSPGALIGPVGEVVRALDPRAVLSEVRTMEAAIDESLDQRRLVMSLLGAFAALAIALAALGLYGVMSHLVAQRTREIGVRMALGATASEVRRMVVTQGLRLCLVGLVLGVVAALALTRLLASQLFGVSPTDPATFAALAALLLLVSVVASLVPAGRATRIDPMIALRAE